jgi:hypothetical protein
MSSPEDRFTVSMYGGHLVFQKCSDEYLPARQIKVNEMSGDGTESSPWVLRVQQAFHPFAMDVLDEDTYERICIAIRDNMDKVVQGVPEMWREARFVTRVPLMERLGCLLTFSRCREDEVRTYSVPNGYMSLRKLATVRVWRVGSAYFFDGMNPSAFHNYVATKGMPTFFEPPEWLRISSNPDLPISDL